MDAMGVFSSWVTALIKLSCCSLRRISRTRKLVFTIIPAISTAKKITPRNNMTPSRQLRMIQPTLSATASATRHTPSTIKNAIVLRREVIRMEAAVLDDFILLWMRTSGYDPKDDLVLRPRKGPSAYATETADGRASTVCMLAMARCPAQKNSASDPPPSTDGRVVRDEQEQHPD